MLSFGQKVGLSMAGGAVIGAGIGVAIGEGLFSPEALQDSAKTAHQTMEGDRNAVNRMEAQLPADCVRVLRAAATSAVTDPTYRYLQTITESNPDVCGVATREIATKYFIIRHNVHIDEENAAVADAAMQPDAAVSNMLKNVGMISALTLMGAGFGPMVASGALGNNVPSRQPAWQ